MDYQMQVQGKRWQVNMMVSEPTDQQAIDRAKNMFDGFSLVPERVVLIRTGSGDPYYAPCQITVSPDGNVDVLELD